MLFHRDRSYDCGRHLFSNEPPLCSSETTRLPETDDEGLRPAAHRDWFLVCVSIYVPCGALAHGSLTSSDIPLSLPLFTCG